MPASECGLSFSTGGLVGEYGQWTVPSFTNEQNISRGSGKRAVVRAGGSASRAAGEQSSTDPGGGFRRNKQQKSNWRIPTENSKRATGRPIVRNFRPWKRDRGRSEIQRNRPVPVPPKWTGDRRPPRRRFPGIWTGGSGRLKTFCRSLRRTVIHGHGEFRRL